MFKNSLFKIGTLMSFIIKDNLLHIFQMVRIYLISGYFSRRFKEFGKGSLFHSIILLTGEKNISIGNNTYFGKNLKLTAVDFYHEKKYDPHIIIGNNCRIGDNNQISSINSISIGDDLLTGTNVLITDHSHGFSALYECKISPVKRRLYSKGEVVIGNNVWIGSNAVILPGVSIGDGCIIGANTVVSKSIPSYSVVVGNSCRTISIKN